jgi:DNA helicase II / ATP-dependent DNA helicase PcrA
VGDDKRSSLNVKSATDELTAWIEDDGNVSPSQREAIRHAGNFFLLSRPGSGKTRAVGIRLARLASVTEGGAIAATSYTNIAIEQIRSTVRERGVVLHERHYTGTLHQFLLTYVLRPFAGLINIKQPFHLIGGDNDDWSGWPTVVYRGENRKRLPVAWLHYTAGGDFVTHQDPRRRIGLTREEAAAEEIDQIRREKQRARRFGLVSLSDAMFYSQQLLESQPVLRDAIAARFKELIVDEAQDTSDVQLRCLELLHSTGKLRSLVLVGDLEQSIYSFQGADPNLCEALVKVCGLQNLPLTENFRSSQAICNVTCRFIGRREPDAAVGPNSESRITPEILLYDASNPATAVEQFQQRLSANGLDPGRAAVLTRRSNLRDEINGLPASEMPASVRTLGRFAALMRSARTVAVRDLRAVEQLLSEMAWGVHAEPLAEEQRRLVRKELMRLSQSLPAFDCNLSDWIARAREEVKLTLAALSDTPAHQAHHRIKSKAGFDEVSALDTFFAVPPALPARTVHDAKGESHSAVLLVAASRGQGKAQTDLWSAALAGEEIAEEDAEELRIAYVALTRAERYCAVALPRDADQSRLQAYLDVGFIQPAQ